MRPISRGVRQCAEMDVESAHTAAALFPQVTPSLPSVLATVWMIALMERAATELIASHLDAGETSVGTNVEITHEQPTCVGRRVRAEAVMIVNEGARYVFEVRAWDGSTLIGGGTHVRYVVQRAQLEARAASHG